MVRPIDLNKAPGLNLSNPGKPIDLSKPQLKREVDDPAIPGLYPVDEYHDIFAPNQSAYASNPAESILGALTPYGDVNDLVEQGSSVLDQLDNQAEAMGLGRPLEEIARRREEAIASLDPDMQLDLERRNPIKGFGDLAEAIGDMRHGFGRNKDGQVCWFVSPHLPTGYAICTPPKPKPSAPVASPQPDEVGNVPITPPICDEARENAIAPWAHWVISYGLGAGYPEVTIASFYDPTKWRLGASAFPYGSPIWRLTGNGEEFYGHLAQYHTRFTLDFRPQNQAWLDANFPGMSKQEIFNSEVERFHQQKLRDVADLNKNYGGGFKICWFQSGFCPEEIETPEQTEQPPPIEEFMQDECCAESLELLRLIARWTGASKQRAFKLPNTILEPQADDSPYAPIYKEAFGEDKEVEIDNLGQLSIYLLQQISTLTGSFPFEVDVPSRIVEASKRANEPIPEKIPVFSLASGIQQVLNLALNTQDDEARLADLIVRSVSESYIARQQATLAYLYLKTLFDWLNIETDETTIELPTLITFPDPDNPPDTEDEMLDFIKPSKIEIKYPELKKKAKDFSDILYPVIEAAQMVRAKWGVTIPKGKEKEFTQDLILKYAATLGYDGAKALIERYKRKQANPDAPIDDNIEDSLDDKEWRELVTQIEQGFATQGIKNPDKPYGRNPNQRPRIRTINDSQDEVR